MELIDESPPPKSKKNEVEIVNLISDDDEEEAKEAKKLPKVNPPETNLEKHSESLATSNETKKSFAVELKMTEEDKPKTPTKKTTNKFIDFGQTETESTTLEECLVTNDHKVIEKSTRDCVVLQETKIVPEKTTEEFTSNQSKQVVSSSKLPGKTTKKATSLQNLSQEKYSSPPSKKAKFIDFGDYEVKKEKAKFIDFGAEDITEPFTEQNIFPVPMHSKFNEVVQKPSSSTDAFDQMDIETEYGHDSDKKVLVGNDLPNCSVVLSRINMDDEPNIIGKERAFVKLNKSISRKIFEYFP